MVAIERGGNERPGALDRSVSRAEIVHRGCRWLYAGDSFEHAGMGNGGSYQLCTLSAALPVTSNDIPVSYADGT